MDRDVHDRFLRYREAYDYFALKETAKILDGPAFEAADKEQRVLEAKGEAARSDDEQARFVELTVLLFRD